MKTKFARVAGLLLLMTLLAVGCSVSIDLAPPPPAGNIREMGRMLFGSYLLPFELAGMTLLLCLVGAAYLVRRREK